MADTLWAALAIFLIMEGLLPFASPTTWRRVFTDMLAMRDGQVRFVGLLCIAAGLILAWVVL